VVSANRISFYISDGLPFYSFFPFFFFMIERCFPETRLPIDMWVPLALMAPFPFFEPLSGNLPKLKSFPFSHRRIQPTPPAVLVLSYGVFFSLVCVVCGGVAGFFLGVCGVFFFFSPLSLLCFLLGGVLLLFWGGDRSGWLGRLWCAFCLVGGGGGGGFFFCGGCCVVGFFFFFWLWLSVGGVCWGGGVGGWVVFFFVFCFFFFFFFLIS